MVARIVAVGAAGFGCVRQSCAMPPRAARKRSALTGIKDISGKMPYSPRSAMHRPRLKPVDQNLCLKYDRPLPRYTSYPTAPHFIPATSTKRYRSWLAAIPPRSRLSLYLHIPFCRSMCWFCGCHTRVAKSDAPVKRYVETLIQEIALLAEALPDGLEAGHVHWGGGSPTMLSASDWTRIMAALREAVPFAADAMIAVELDPRTATGDLIRAYAQGGVKRASIGVQDFDRRVQASINRIQSFEATRHVVDELRAHGIESVNVDLMYGLPFQTVAGIRETAAHALALSPMRVSLFGYAHVPWMKPHQKRIPAEALAGPAERLAQATAAAEVLAGAGMRRIGLDHFADPADPLCAAANAGTLRRNFQGYTDDNAPALIGLGASAIGCLPQGYAQNATAIPEWQEAVASGDFPIVRERQLTKEDRLRGHIIERLMCDLRIDLTAVAEAQESDSGWVFETVQGLAELASDGLVEISDGTIAVTEKGRPFLRVVAAAFDQYLGTAGRHARAV